MLNDEADILHHQGKFYIDSDGFFFTKSKTTTTQLKYHKIMKREKKDVATVLWLKDIPFAFAEKSPPDPDLSWAGLLYDSGIPWKIYDFSEEKQKDTWRKI